MLIDHRNFCFTQIPDITDMIFLRSPKTLFWGPFLRIFGHFCPMGTFSKKSGSVTLTIYGPLKACKFHKKLTRQFRENLRTDRRTDRQMDPILYDPYG